jgi:hypothetical protein
MIKPIHWGKKSCFKVRYTHEQRKNQAMNIGKCTGYTDSLTKFSPIGWLFTLGSFLMHQQCINFDKNGLGFFLGEFFTNSFFSTGISEPVPRLYATGSSSASTWKLSHHLTTLLLEQLSLNPT